MIDKTRCKFVLNSVKEWPDYPVQKEFEFVTQYDESIPEDMRFVKATSFGTITIRVGNPYAIEFLKSAKSFYVDFSVAEPKIVPVVEQSTEQVKV